MARIVRRSETYHPAVIESLDDAGRTIVRASHHYAEDDGWSVTINTAPRSLPDLKVVGKLQNDEHGYVHQLVEVLTEAIESRGWMPAYSLT